jgi:NAD(P)-dependent dehydrogenase (short-subunit alcohol dehydrogenase family)
MDRYFEGRQIVVSGAGRDFGRTVALLSARAGATVHLSARTAEAAERTAATITAEGGTAYADACDVANPDHIRRWFDAIASRTDRIDTLFLNAGRWEEETDLEAITDDAVGDIIASNLIGSILMTKSCLPLLRAAPSPDIVAMVSICAVPGYVESPAHPVFYAAKHGLAGFCDIMAERLRADNVRMTALYPIDFDNIAPDTPEWDENRSPSGLVTARSVWGAIMFALSQPPKCRTEKIVFKGKRWDQV